MKILTVFLIFLACVASEEQNQTVLPRNIENNFTLKHHRTSIFGSRITGGQSARRGQIPYQVGLQIALGDESTFCGGTLISERSVLTAAHCCEDALNITVVLGSVQIYNRTEPNRTVIRVSRKGIKIHEGWNSDEAVNDICILQLPNEVTLSPYIAIAELPQDDTRDFNNQNVIASGWGRVSDASSAISPDLQYAKMLVMSNFYCNFYFFGSIRETNICTSGRGGISTCNGDSGGPIVLEKNNRPIPTVVGITSFGSQMGCQRGWPVVYTRVSKYLNWIKRNMV